MPEQLDFLASLDFPGRSTVLVREIAERLGLSEKHLFNEIDTGSLIVIDAKSAGASRRCARVPVECYRDYVLKRLTGNVGSRAELLRNLPTAVRRQLLRELQESFSHV